MRKYYPQSITPISVKAFLVDFISSRVPLSLSFRVQEVSGFEV